LGLHAEHGSLVKAVGTKTSGAALSRLGLLALSRSFACLAG
jgi:hypothetical protein